VSDRDAVDAAYRERRADEAAFVDVAYDALRDDALDVLDQEIEEAEWNALPEEQKCAH
jgi:hypothetical protein